LQTSTVREALEFSALLRQPASVSKEEKLAYVDEVINLLEMREVSITNVLRRGNLLNLYSMPTLSSEYLVKGSTWSSASALQLVSSLLPNHSSYCSW
jgi:hypothetical protein